MNTTMGDDAAGPRHRVTVVFEFDEEQRRDLFLEEMCASRHDGEQVTVSTSCDQFTASVDAADVALSQAYA